MPAISDNNQSTNQSIDQRQIIAFNKFITNTFTGEPSYNLNVINSYINSDGNYTLEISITGAGTVASSDDLDNLSNHVSFSKIHIIIPPKIVKDSKIYLQMISYNKTRGVYLDPYEFYEPAFMIMPPKEYYGVQYKNGLANGFANNGSVLWDDKANPNIKYPPITIKFKPSSNTPGGDYILNLILFYKDINNTWHASKEIVPIHINYWYEEERMQYLATFTLFCGIITAIAEIIKIFTEGNKPWRNELIVLAIIVVLAAFLIFTFI